jgi:hypothetical protein
MTWRPIHSSLAVLAALVCVYQVAIGSWWLAFAARVCALVFGLEAAGVRTLGRTARVLRERRKRIASGPPQE